MRATLECEVCGALWETDGIIAALPPPYDAVNGRFIADDVPQCPECGQSDSWSYSWFEEAKEEW